MNYLPNRTSIPARGDISERLIFTNEQIHTYLMSCVVSWIHFQSTHVRYTVIFHLTLHRKTPSRCHIQPRSIHTYMNTRKYKYKSKDRERPS